MRVKARCRVCGAAVDYFGDVCVGCDAAVNDLAVADSRALETRAADAEAGEV